MSRTGVVRLRLTERGAEQLDTLSELHLTELAHLAPTMQALWSALEDGDGVGGAAQGERCGQPADPTAHDHDVLGHRART